MQPITEIISRTPTGQIISESFGSTEVQRPAETSAHAFAEREKALVQSLFIMAERKPRNTVQFEQGLLKECERPGFAEAARYRIPRKKWNPETRQQEEIHIEGFSIRFAEAAMRHWTNVFCQQQIVFEDDEKRIVRFTVIDLQNCIPLIGEMQLNKTVERKGFLAKTKNPDGSLKWDPPSGRTVFAQRDNSVGERIFIVAATEEELQMKQASAWSKFIRNVLRFMPGDILDEALAQIEKTLKGQSPEAARSRLLNSFDKLKITLADLQTFLGHSVEAITAAEIDDLRKIYTALKDGETTWAAVIEDRSHSAGSKEDAEEAIKRTKEAIKREQGGSTEGSSTSSTEQAKADAEQTDGAAAPEQGGKAPDPDAPQAGKKAGQSKLKL